MSRGITPPPKRRRISSQESNITTRATEKLSTSQSISNDSRTIRIFAWNINGITPFLQRPITSFFSKTSTSESAVDPPPASLRTFLHRHQWPELLFLQEVKISPSDNKTQAAVRTAINTPLSSKDEGPKYEACYTLPSDRYNARGFGGRVYGVCTLLRTDFLATHVTRVRDVEWDIEGRVSVVELRTEPKLALWNIYAVNGTSNPYRSPKTGEAQGTRHDRKLAFHESLMRECRSMEEEGWRHVLAGDFNVAPARIDGYPNLRTFPHQHVLNRADFNRKFFVGEEGLRGVDVWRWMKGEERKYTYFPRGRQWGSSCDRVDLIIASKGLVEERKILDVEILDNAKERGTSDHVPLWVEVMISGADEEQCLANSNRSSNSLT